jgi:predicted nucleotidyltransferase component of viral defense system
MITPDDLKRIAGREKVGLGTIEKDHAITVALMVLSGTSFSDTLVFKGGTAIKKMFYPETRFSEDLDFDCDRNLARLLEREIKKPLLENNEGVNYVGIREEDVRAENARRLSLQYRDSNDFLTNIKIDLAFLEKPLMKAEKMEVKNLYDMKNIMIVTMNIEEIMAEKVRAFIHTARPRHLYDIWFLLGKRIRPTKKLIDKKLSVYNQSFHLSAMEDSIENVASDWRNDLQALTPEVPEFAEAQSTVIKAFSKI